MTELLIDENKIGDELTLKQEAFCRFYTQNTELFGNGTLSYAEAYGYDLDSANRNDAEYEFVVDEVEGEDYADSELDEPVKASKKRKLVRPSTYDVMCNICASGASKLLRNPKIDQRLSVLLNEMLTDHNVDAEISKVILQNRDLGSKMRAISEYNKVKNRVIERKEIKVTGLSEEERQRLDQLLG